VNLVFDEDELYIVVKHLPPCAAAAARRGRWDHQSWCCRRNPRLPGSTCAGTRRLQRTHARHVTVERRAQWPRWHTHLRQSRFPPSPRRRQGFVAAAADWRPHSCLLGQERTVRSRFIPAPENAEHVPQAASAGCTTQAACSAMHRCPAGYVPQRWMPATVPHCCWRGGQCADRTRHALSPQLHSRCWGGDVSELRLEPVKHCCGPPLLTRQAICRLRSHRPRHRDPRWPQCRFLFRQVEDCIAPSSTRQAMC